MKKTEVFRFVVVLLILTMSVALFGYAAVFNITTAAPQKREVVYPYVIKAYHGNIAVYKNGESTPQEVYDLPISILPEADAKDLETGIFAKDEQELRRLIEDLTG